MPAKKPTKPTFQFKGYVPYTLSSSDKKDYIKWREKADSKWIFEALDAVTKSGYAIRLSFSDDRLAYICQMQAVASLEQPDANGYILSSFAPNAYDALLLTLYKHTVILRGIWMFGPPEGTEQWG